jgi:nucleotide-binding universal stress UspA family protein
MVELNPLGIVLAIIFVASMVSLFVWMFRVPAALSLPAVKIFSSVAVVHKILVPIVEDIPSERAVELACRLGNGKKAELILVHVIVVPHALPLDAAMPGPEKIAEQALGLGRVIAGRYGVHVQTHVVRHRNAAQGILRVADTERVDAIVLGMGLKSRIPGEWGKTSAEIFQRANCEVLLDKAPIAARPIALAA